MWCYSVHVLKCCRDQISEMNRSRLLIAVSRIYCNTHFFLQLFIKPLTFHSSLQWSRLGQICTGLPAEESSSESLQPSRSPRLWTLWSCCRGRWPGSRECFRENMKWLHLYFTQGCFFSWVIGTVKQFDRWLPGVLRLRLGLQQEVLAHGGIKDIAMWRSRRQEHGLHVTRLTFWYRRKDWNTDAKHYQDTSHTMTL